MASDVTRTLLTVSKLRGVGPATLIRLLDRPGVENADVEQLARWEPSIGNALDEQSALDRAQDAAEKALADTAKLGAWVLSPLDADYPAFLRATPDRPPILFAKGDRRALSRRAIGIIGTREPTAHGLIVAGRIAEYFAQREWLVVSGLALGVDAAAHEATVQAGGLTAAVLAHGLDQIYPKKNAKLAERIVETGGLLLTEYPPGTRPYGPNFVKRDRIQAGLSQAVVVVQTDVRGGSLHASRAALQYGRILAYPIPTPRDVSNAEPKIQGILKLMTAPPAEAARFLEVSVEALQRVIALRSREDYMLLESQVSTLRPPTIEKRTNGKGRHSGEPIQYDTFMTTLAPTSPTKPYRVFLSHNASDSSLVAKIKDASRAIGISVYTYNDDVRAGMTLSDKLVGEIREANAVVALLTSDGIFRPAIQQEIGCAIGLGKRVVPIVEAGLDAQQLTLLQGREYITLDKESPERAVLALQQSLTHHKNAIDAEATAAANKELLVLLGLLFLIGALVFSAEK